MSAFKLSYAVDAARAAFNNHLGDVSVLKGFVVIGLLAALSVIAAVRSFARAQPKPRYERQPVRDCAEVTRIA